MLQLARELELSGLVPDAVKRVTGSHAQVAVIDAELPVSGPIPVSDPYEEPCSLCTEHEDWYILTCVCHTVRA